MEKACDCVPFFYLNYFYFYTCLLNISKRWRQHVHLLHMI